MKDYRLESDLSKDFCNLLRSMDFDVQRIESGATGVGIPDVYYVNYGVSGWIELKVTHRLYRGYVDNIQWRKGQQAWMIHRNKKYGKIICHTLAAYKDMFVLLPMDHFYEQGEDIKKEWTGKTLRELI